MQAREVTEEKISVEIISRRAGDPPMLVADVSLAQKQLAWKPMHLDIKSIVRNAWLYELTRCGKEQKCEVETKRTTQLSLTTVDATAPSLNNSSYCLQLFKPATVVVAANALPHAGLR